MHRRFSYLLALRPFPSEELTLFKQESMGKDMMLTNWRQEDRPVIALLAHPGHELLVSQLLQDCSATVAWLSDGSGGTQRSRNSFTRSLLEGCGCPADPVAGFAPDRLLYQAIMDRRLEIFDPVVDALEASINDLRPSTIIVDPMEYFNPLHDLANTIADILIARASRRGMPICKLVYANEYPEQFDRKDATVERTLSVAELDQKMQRLEAYVPLHQEWQRMQSAGKLGDMGTERLFPDAVRLADIATPIGTRFKTAHYEDYGRLAVSKGVYKDCLTFADHALPFAKAMVARHCGPAA
jgi:hypothetical protein